jgi:hypothetical protein
MVMHVCNPSTQEAEAGGLRITSQSEQVQWQPGLDSETLSQKTKKQKKY